MRVLLHVCCGVCGAGAAERLLSQGHEVLGLFYNPNIHPAEEYERRLGAARCAFEMLSAPLEAGPYEFEEWQQQTQGLGGEPEGGRRCEVCFRMRLQQAHRRAVEQGCDAFTTTLTISPHKRAEVVNRIGREIGGEMFLACDFKKKDGFARATALAKQWGLHRQDYCGCVYSLEQRPVR